ncbi:MAG: hypothetical protein C4518_11295 [Desulfobacteraceae bacterium]|nr:MAG: hypothetical protein C4518_11295 [Desulfobacteraceae bacterium]
MAWAKTRWHRGRPGLVIPIKCIATGRLIGFYPLKQFAPVIHGNQKGSGPHRNGQKPLQTDVSLFFFTANSLKEIPVEFISLVQRVVENLW